MIERPVLITFTGPPAVGKSTAIKQLAGLSRRSGVSFYEVGDYPILKRFAQANRTNSKIVVWPTGSLIGSDDFMIVPAAYQEVSTHVAEVLAEEILSRLSSYIVIASEVAMGAGDPPTDYGNHYFDILARVLASQMDLANIQLDMPVATLRQRAIDRYRRFPHKSPPPEVTDRYISSDGLVQSSLPYAVRSGFDCVANEMIDNSGAPEDTRSSLITVFSEVLQLAP